MRQTAILYHVYELSGSALKLGLTGLVQAVPLFALAIFAGALADLMDRKKIVLFCIGFHFLLAASLGVLTATGAIRVWHILVMTGLGSAVNTFLNPARHALIPRLVPRSHLMNAVSLTVSTGQTSQFIGPLFAGLAIAVFGMENAYLIIALLHVPAAVGLGVLRTSGEPLHFERPGLRESLFGGISFVRSELIILGLLLLDFGVMSVGYYRHLLPIFAKDIFGMGPAGYGVLASSPAVGGLLGVGLLLIAREVKRKGLLALSGLLLFSLSLGFLAMAPWFWMAIVAVGALGFGNAVQVVTRRTVVQLLTPDRLQGRVLAMVTTFGQGGGAVGAMVVGFTASVFGAPGAMLLGCGLATTLTLGLWWGWAGLRKFGSEEMSLATSRLFR